MPTADQDPPGTRIAGWFGSARWAVAARENIWT
jgi:hypothetical protein